MDIEQNISVAIFVVLFFFIAVRKMPQEIREAVSSCRHRSRQRSLVDTKLSIFSGSITRLDKLKSSEYEEL